MSQDDRNWFHGKITREHSEELLMNENHEDGTFLVRESNTAVGDYVLTLVYQNNVVHYQIRRHGEDAFFSIDDRVKILHGLDTLVEFYQQAANGLVIKLMKHIRKMPPPNDACSHGTTNLLHRATISNNHTVLSPLLQCSYRNFDAKNPDGQTAMHLAAMHCDESILRLLLDANVSVNCMDSAGNTPLHYACRSKSGSFVRALIESRANVQARNMKNGFVPLHDAAKSGNLEAVQELLAAHAPYLPRTSFGEFPIDLAKEQGHEHVTTFLSNFKLPAASTHKNKWYHGTLKREEATEILQNFARNLQEQEQVAATAQILEKTTDSLENNNLLPKLDTSGCFLVRYSERKNAGSGYVLTLLWNQNVKNFIISQSTNYLFIDDGPYHPSLEHLVEHFMRFSDGLPVNLKYAVPPKPKPPLPLFTTMPRVKAKMKSPTSPIINNNNNNNMNNVTNSKEKNKMLPQHAHTLNPRRNIGNVVFNTLKIRSPKKENSKNKNITKAAAKLCQDAQELKQVQTLLKDISFSSEISIKQFDNSSTATAAPVTIDVDSFYNVPKNNAAIAEITQQQDAAMVKQRLLLLEHKTDAEVEYFTKSDLAIEYAANCDKTPITIQDAKLPINANCYISAFELYAFLNNSPLLNDEIDTSSASTINNVDDRNDESALKLAHAKQYIIPRQHLELTDVIGEGEFGTVYKGIYKHNGAVGEKQDVAIKTLRDEHCLHNKQAFFREAAVMMRLRHHCIVQLIGITRGKSLMMVQELIASGSMLDFILINRNKSQLQYDLKLWSAQIACGMQYLEACHFVHRDLAARNILLASRNQAKISDFGLSRAMAKDNDFYQASQGGKWPIKWYAPESFNNGIFSHASDVWSFGVTLWEMFSLGEQPFGEMGGKDAINLIENGFRLPQPPYCPDNVYEIMLNCWHYKAKDRPTFHYLMEFFAKDPLYQNIIELIRSEHIS